MNLNRHILFISILILSACRSSYSVCDSSNRYEAVDSSEIEKDEKLETIIGPYRSSLEKEMNLVLCQNEKAMIKRRPESELGNFVADLCLVRSRALYDGKIDGGLFNTGGLRTALPQGDITVGKIYELMPFDNELVVVSLPYDEVMAMMEYLASRGGEPISDMSIIIEIDGSSSQEKIGSRNIEERDYNIVTSDYLAGGGDNMVFLTAGHRKSITSLGLKIRDAILDECREFGLKKEPINTQLDGRIKTRN
jgi:2',3'-cyclic-nucleotide 2'-phosphodiesterase (5'-nucleotidase family)